MASRVQQQYGNSDDALMHADILYVGLCSVDDDMILRLCSCSRDLELTMVMFFLSVGVLFRDGQGVQKWVHQAH